uniref:Uncharacterized protein n=1 Tax=uncultured bacterium contig00078 TaxID=1181556 RepID=A0A806KH45_9BACT|nr:hypothetical protein [uncultured bacterium contig00078]
MDFKIQMAGVKTIYLFLRSVLGRLWFIILARIARIAKEGIAAFSR